MVCPNCGGDLTTTSRPFTPPWLCDACHLGWWNAQLTDAAAAAWRPMFWDFGASTASVAAAVVMEQGG